MICLGLVLATAAVYQRVGGFEFVSFDDKKYVSENRQVLNGLTWGNVKWAFTTNATANWHPVTWLSLMLDCEVFEDKARACHRTNVLFHIANSLLLFLILKQTTRALWLSAFVAAMFALHPLHVESVAWVSERKDVLSTFFWLLTMWGYVRYCKHRCLTRYLVVVVFFVSGLMAKPMLVTLPFVLLLLDYWPLERLKGDSKQIISLIREKLPLFVLSIVFCAVTYLVQQSKGAVRFTEALSFQVRLCNALVSYSSYIGKMIWPSGLAIFYPYPIKILIWMTVISTGLLIVISVSVFLLRKKRWLVVGWLWYLGTLVPVIGLVQVGAQGRADRYTYVPLIGLFIIVAWGVGRLSEKLRRQKGAFVFSICMLTALAVCARRQVGYWKDNVTLFGRAAAVTERNYLAHNHLGLAYAKRNQLDKAIEEHRRAVSIKPNYAEAENNLGMELALKGSYAEAIEHYKKALRIEPRAETYNNLGAAMMFMSMDLEDAAKQFEKSLELEPSYSSAHVNLATVLVFLGQIDEAIWHCREVLKVNPNSKRARQGLQQALEAREHPEQQKKRQLKMVIPK